METVRKFNQLNLGPIVNKPQSIPTGKRKGLKRMSLFIFKLYHILGQKSRCVIGRNFIGYLSNSFCILSAKPFIISTLFVSMRRDGIHFFVSLFQSWFLPVILL